MTEIQHIPISKLILSESNPRTITKENLAKLCNSLENDPTFLECRPVLVNEIDGKFYVYAGNQRIQAAKKLKWKTIPCILNKNLDNQIVKERTIRDNTHFGEFDYDILADQYDIDILLENGITLKDMHIDLPDLEEDSKPNDKEKCEYCGK